MNIDKQEFELKNYIIYFLNYFVDKRKWPIFAPHLRDKPSKVKGVVVQLVRIPACHAGGRGFESRPYRRRRLLW